MATTERQFEIPRLSVTVRVNSIDHALLLEPRRTLLDALHHDLQLTSSGLAVVNSDHYHTYLRCGYPAA